MAIKRVRIDPAKLLTATPEDRRKLYAETQYEVEGKLGNVRSADATAGSGAKRISERLNQRGLWLDLNDLMGVPNRGPPLDRRDVFQGMDTGMLTEEFPTRHDDIIMEENYHTPRAQPRYGDYDAPRQQPAPRQPQQQRQALREQIVGERRPAPPLPAATSSAPPWRVKAFMGETKGGSEVPIWKVVNAKTGSSIDTMFRIEQVATKVAAYLNESGDSNDPRALSVIHTYTKRDQLLKEARGLEKTADGKPMKTERLRTIRSEINQLDWRLGI